MNSLSSSVCRHVATVLLLRGSLKPGAHLVAGTTHAKVRVMIDSMGSPPSLAGQSLFRDGRNSQMLAMKFSKARNKMSRRPWVTIGAKRNSRPWMIDIDAINTKVPSLRVVICVLSYVHLCRSAVQPLLSCCITLQSHLSHFCTNPYNCGICPSGLP